MNLFGITCILCLVVLACLAGYQFYEVLNLPMPQECATYSTKIPNPQGGYATDYGTICRNNSGDWIIQD